MNIKLVELNKKGIDAVLRGRIDQAENYFRSAIQLDSNSFEATFNLIKLLHMNHRYHDAILSFNQIDSCNLSSFLPLSIVNILGDCSVKDHNMLAACDCCEILHSTFPEHIETACTYSYILILSLIHI